MLDRVLSFIVLFTALGMLSPSAEATANIQDSYYKHIPIATTSGHEEYPDIAFCPATSEYLIVYDANYVITGQRLDVFGSTIGDPFEISSETVDGGVMPVVACVKGDSEYFAIAWIIYKQTGVYHIQIQAVHGSYQPEPLSQLHGDPLIVPGNDSAELFPDIACSTDENTCLLVYQYMVDTMETRAQRIAVTESGVTFVGDPFNFPMEYPYQSYPVVSWNSLDDDYLVAWEQETNIVDHKGIGYAHVLGLEQGPGLNELQHAPAWLYIQAEDTRECFHPQVAHNPQTGKYLVIFTCDDSDSGADGEIILQRVDGTGTGLQGASVSFTNIGGFSAERILAADIWSVSRSSTESQFMIAAIPWQSMPTEFKWLYLLPIKGIYDPLSPDQLDGDSMLIRQADQLYPGGTGDPTSGRFILVDEEGTFAGPNDIYGYLFAPFVGRFPIIFNGVE
jgi:hypothetical protein